MFLNLRKLHIFRLGKMANEIAMRGGAHGHILPQVVKLFLFTNGIHVILNTLKYFPRSSTRTILRLNLPAAMVLVPLNLSIV